MPTHSAIYKYLHNMYNVCTLYYKRGHFTLVYNEGGVPDKLYIFHVEQSETPHAAGIMH